MARRAVALAVVAVAAVIATIGAVAGDLDASDGSDGARPITPVARALPARVTVSTRGRLQRVPGSFLGVSTEYWTLPFDVRRLRLFERALSLLHVPGEAPLVLRIGGNSADHAFYDPGLRHVPGWAYSLTPRWIGRTAALVAGAHLHVILDLDLITGSPRLDAGWVAAAERRFPVGSIVGLEIGNEPDLYNRSLWQRRVGLAARGAFTAAALPPALTPADYARAYRAYAHALAQVAPGVPLLGPAINHPRRGVRWIETLVSGPHPGLRAITAHDYPYSGCAAPGTPSFATAGRLLGRHATDSVYTVLAPAARAAHRAGLPLRVTEINSVGCGGRAGVSNAFATALWAPGALFEAVRAGAEGAELHVRVHTVNPPWEITRAGIAPRPLLYGLIAFREMLGPGARMARIAVHAARRLDLAAWAVRVGRHRLNVLLIDRSRERAAVALRVRARGPAAVQRLLAPSAGARGDVTLAGRRLDDRLRWVGRRRVARVARRRGGYRIGVRGVSAAIVSLRVA